MVAAFSGSSDKRSVDNRHDMDCTENLDIIVIGAGLSGICALIRAQKKLPNAKVAVFEKGNHVGGTWAKNTYPGLSCDIHSQLYSYSFAPNPDWSEAYASQPEILAYIDSVVSRFDCEPHVHLNQECKGAEWLDDEFLWRVHFVDLVSGRRYARHSRFLITAVGFSDVPNGTEGIHDLEKFEGRVFHSARWDHSFDFQDKDVVVIGNGCSANQFVPHLLKHSSIRSMVQVMRSPHWIAPKANHPVSAWVKWAFRTFPTMNRLWRFCLSAKHDLVFHAFKTTAIGGLVRRALQNWVRDYMRRTAPSEYHDLVIPDYELGGKRFVLDHGYLDSLRDPRLKLLRSPSLTVVEPRKVQTETGETFTADVIIVANGFKTQELLTPMTIAGQDGKTLPSIWHEEGNFPSAYMGVSVPSFPNLFLLTGPNTLPVGHSTLSGVEYSVEYILRILTRVLANNSAHLLPANSKSTKNGDKTEFGKVKITVTPTAHKTFSNDIEARMRRFVGPHSVPGVRSWYVDARTGRNTLTWPGSQFEFWWGRCVKGVRWGDFEVVVKDGVEGEGEGEE